MRILLVEDDAQLGAALQAGLRQTGLAVDWARDGQAAEWALKTESFDGVVLDLGLPRVDGMTVLQHMRARGNDVPVLILTARDGVGDKINGLDAGADDYLIKPVDLDELAARLRALSRRRAGRSAPELIHGEIVLNPAERSVYRNGLLVELSVREFSLLQTLLENVGRILSKSQLEQSLYGWRDEPDSNVLEVHIHHLRKKLGADLIRTLRGVGYGIARPNAAKTTAP